MNKRVLKEYQQILAQEHFEDHNIIALGPAQEDNLSHWEATIRGPDDTPYVGSQFKLFIDIPLNYPSVPPVIHFESERMPHVNVKLSNGEICLDILKENWTPIFNLQYCLSCILRLLSDPNTDSPMNLDLASVLRNGDLGAYTGLIKYQLNYNKSGSHTPDR